MKNTYITFVIALVLVSGGSFYGGMKYQSNKDAVSATTGGFGTAPAGRRTGGQFAGRGGMNPASGVVNGKVLATDAKGLTIQTRDGSSKIVFVTPTTKVEKTVDGAVADVVAQSNVTVMGTTNSDGSVTAVTVQIRPAGMVPPFGQGSTSSTRATTSTR